MAPTVCMEADDNPIHQNKKGDNSASYSVINYVGKIQRQQHHKSTRPYSKRISKSESLDERTSSSSLSLLSASSNNSVSQRLLSLDEEIVHNQEVNLERRRSLSVSSSGCSSSMDDRNFDFSPTETDSNCRCNSYNISDFDDDGFREENSRSSSYSDFSLQHYNNHNYNVTHHQSNTKDLFEIAIKTVKLIRRNHELQQRLSALKEETSAFIESVMANPENESLRNKLMTVEK